MRYLDKFTDIEILNEFVRRGLLTPKEAQIALMTKELPSRLFDGEDSEGEEWKKNIK